MLGKGYSQRGELIPGLLPTGGINARDPAMSLSPSDAMDLVNVVTDKFGLSTRGGYQWFAYDLPGVDDVPTIMSFYPATANKSSTIRNSLNPLNLPEVIPPDSINLGGLLFACTNNNIYDITAGGGGPWTPQTNIGVVTSNYWTWRNFQNEGGNYLLACNNEGGYIIYGSYGFSDGFSNGFAVQSVGFDRVVEGNQPGQITGINPDEFCYVMAWKRRLFFIQKNSTLAWYLPVEQITGTVKPFDFGSQFRHGGYLAALVNWTLDGGEGVDDYLVAISSEGDVVIYKGYDPNAAAENPSAFQLHGIWYVGALPGGFRQVDPYGGDVYILSIAGLSALSRLVNDKSGVQGMGEISDKIDPIITEYMRASNRSNEWYLKIVPPQDMIIVGLPEVVIRYGVSQLTYSIPTGAWQRFANVPAAHFTNHDALIFAGGDVAQSIDAGGKVFLMFQNAADNVDPYTETVTGNTIKCRVIPAYSSFGKPGHWKTFPMVRPAFLALSEPPFSIQILANYQAPSYSSKPTVPTASGSRWDSGLWDTAKWAGEPLPFMKWLGTVGAGYSATVQLDFESVGNTRITNIDWWVVGGGAL